METYPYTISGEALWVWRSSAIAQARTINIDRGEVDWLLRGLCQIDTLSLRLGTLAQQTTVAAQISLADLEALWTKRVSDRAPIQHLVGKTTWRQFSLRVSPNVLIPRPETELMIDIAKELTERHPYADQLKQGIWVDLGTGSGAIALGLAEIFPTAEILAVDVSAAALEIAQQNVIENGFSDRIRCLQGSWFEPLDSWRDKFAGVLSNPPYIPSEIVPTLAPEVAHHEPRLALDGGQDGLESVRQLVAIAPNYLQPHGLWLVELMTGQARSVVDWLVQAQTYQTISSHPDLAGVERFVSALKTDL